MDKTRAKNAGSDKSHTTHNKKMRHLKKEKLGSERQSKVNRILNNIERSIMRPFSTSINNINEQTSATKTVSNSSTKHINTTESSADCSNGTRNINFSNSCDRQNPKSNRMTRATMNGIKTNSENKSTSDERSLDSSVRKGQQKVLKDQVATTEFYLGRDRRNVAAVQNLEMPGVNNSVDFSGHVNGKLDSPQSMSKAPNIQAKTPPATTQHTLNKFQQQLVSTLRHHNTHCQSSTKPLPTISNKLSIPPPHANEEARSYNQSLLFSRSIADAATSLSVNQTHKSDPKTTPQQNEPSSKKNSATSRLIASSGAKTTLTSTTKPINSTSISNHRTSSPASSAKSLPSIVTRLGSQLNGSLKKKSPKNTDGDSNLISKTEDEESGFSNYQSRRPPLRSMVNNQPINDNNTTSIPPIDSTTLSTATNTTASNMIPTPQCYWQSQNCTNVYNSNRPFSYQGQPQQQYPTVNSQIFQNSHLFMPINQVSTMSQLTRKNLDGVQYNLQEQQQQVGANYFNSMRHQHQPFSNAEQPLYGVHSVPSQLKSYMLAGNSDNSQQIYANAPPKPRRYQFYDNFMENPNCTAQLAKTTTAPGMLSTIRSGSTMQHQHQIRHFDQVAAAVRSNHCDRSALGNIASNLKVSNLNPNGVIDMSAVNCKQVSYDNHLSPNVYYEQNALQQNQQQLGFGLLSKSKSSLESGDLMKFRQNKQIVSSSVARTPIWHPIQLTNGNIVAGSSHQHDLASLSGISQQRTATNGVNLQRSKSVTQLLPEYEYQAQISGRAKEMWHDSRQVSNNLRYLSSASITNLNNAADMNCYPNHGVQYVLNSDRSGFNKALSSYQLNDLGQFYDSIHATQLQQKYQQIYPGRLFPNATIRRAATNDWLLKQQQHLMKQNEFNFTNTTPTTRNDDKAVLSSSSSTSNNNSGMFVRQHVQAPISEGLITSDDSKPSLDDKIRHLVIVNDNRDTGGVTRLVNKVGATYSAKFDQVNQSSDNKSSTSSCQISRQVLTTKGHNNALQRRDIPANTVSQCSLVDNNLNTQKLGKTLSQSPTVCNSIQTFTLERNIGETSSATSDIFSNRNDTNDINNLVMGNRQNRHYQVNVPALPSSTTVKSADDSPSGEVNSHLIVDLTTPRVLAKTQTTLSSNQLSFNNANINSQGNENRSINHVGLPQPLNTSPQTSDKGALTSKLDLRPESRVTDRLKDATSKTNLVERTAPYYYSDLKSDEQRQALFNIVQQKSLSPPPQLLSRSADQSNTRLGPKSATLHSKQAKLLSENLMHRQQRPSIQAQPDFSSTTNVTKNINRLFDTTSANRSQNDNMARSMLVLSNSEGLNQFSQQVATKQGSRPSPHLLTSCLAKKPIKSKSLDNINQTLAPKSSDLNNIPNPVYENIRLSSKLMNAINCSARQPSTATSDESMDSILSSSLEDSDSNSDIIDDIKLSPTDNHINDISRLIEQLKINHSKLTDEYRSTLVRITKTINSKNKQTINSSAGKIGTEKIARKLDLLKLKSKKCESRSKNQLALIQMMENVLRQSKLRAESINRYQSSHSGAWSNDSISSENNRDSSAFNISKTVETPNGSNSLPSVDNSYDKKSSTVTAQLSSDLNSKTKETNKISTDLKNSRSNQENSESSLNHTLRKANDDGSEIYKIGSFESSYKDKLITSSVAEKILDIEKRTRELPNNSSPADEKLPFSTDKTPEKSPISDSAHASSPNINSGSSNANNSLNSITNGFQPLRDDDDFIEFYSSDISGHRSNFEASQFSASDYNTSTSASESSASGLCTDSLGSTKNMYNSQFTNKRNMRSENLDSSYSKLRESKPRSHNNLSALHDKTLQDAPSTNGRHSADLDSIRSGKFTNVLGNVIDVDVCPVNNLSQCSPMEN